MARLRDQKIAAVMTTDGELHAVKQERHPARTYGRGSFLIIFTDHYDALLDRIDNGATLKVLNRLLKMLSFTEFRPVNQDALAQKARISQAAVSRSLKELLALNAIEREGKGPTTQWRLVTEWGWQGDAATFHAFRAGRLKGKKPPSHANQSRIIYIM